MERYTAYGLAIRSALPLPELTPGWDRAGPGFEADVDIRLTSLQTDVADLRTGTQRIAVTPREARFVWDDVGAFVVRDGREILADPLPGVDDRLVRLSILGPAMATLLQQAGFLVLHASAVDMGGNAVAFLGASESGKSTMAAALHARGYSLVVDDIVAVRFSDGRAEVFPGFPQFKLWPDAVAALGGDPDTLSRTEPGFEKRAQPVYVTDGPSAHESLPLGRIYVLAQGEAVEIEPLSPREIFFELVSHSYGIDWLHSVSGGAYFLSRAEIARCVPVRLLRRPWSLRTLADVTSAVEKDVAAGI